MNSFEIVLYRYTAESGPVEVEDRPEGLTFPFRLVATPNTLYFISAENDVRSIYRYTTSDGISLAPNSALPNPNFVQSAFVPLGNALYFDGLDSDTFERELWSYTEARGIEQVADIYPGPFRSVPQSIFSDGESLFFSAQAPVVGRELHRYDPPALPTTGSISGLIYNDADATGAFDEGEAGLAGVTVELYEDTDASGTLDPDEPKVSEVVTSSPPDARTEDGSGSYRFDNVAAGDYLVVVAPTPEGFLATTPDTLAVTLVGGQDQTGQDIGFLDVVPVFDLALLASSEITGPGQGLLRAAVINRGSEVAARVRVKVGQQRGLTVSPRQILIGEVAPGERAEVVFTFAGAQQDAQVRLRVTDLDTEGDEADFDNNTVILFPMTVTGDDERMPVVVGTATGSLVAGRAEDRQPGDTGLTTVALAPGATNLTLDVDSFNAGDGTVGFTARAVDTAQEATGTLVATDGNGNEGTLALDIPAGGVPLTLVPFTTPDEVPVILGPAGGSFWFTAGITNPTDSPVEQEVWLVFIDTEGTETNVFGPITARARPGQTADERFEPMLGADDPAGAYAYEARVGSFPDEVVAADRFTFEKLGAATRQRLASARSAAVTDAPALYTPGVTGTIWGVTDNAEWARLLAADAARKAALAEEEAALAEAAESETEPLPEVFALVEPYPNPMSGLASVRFELPEEAEVTVTLYDVLGRTVAVLAQGTFEAGRHEALLDGRTLASGTYVVRFEAGERALAKTVTVVR
ncbi:MAG: SdrD B-like domain-containing protein [Bacteroidota bacterium]